MDAECPWILNVLSQDSRHSPNQPVLIVSSVSTLFIHLVIYSLIDYLFIYSFSYMVIYLSTHQ